jgi:hypothetical protein
MGATQPPSEFVRPGNPVVVVSTGRSGISGWKRREVAKVGAQHFTVEDVEIGGKPVKFRNRPGAFGVSFVTDQPAHTAASESVGMVVIEDGSPDAERARAAVRERLAVNRVTTAADAWRKVEDRRTSVTAYRNRPTPAEVDAALVELAAAAVELRGVLGVPEGTEA